MFYFNVLLHSCWKVLRRVVHGSYKHGSDIKALCGLDWNLLFTVHFYVPGPVLMRTRVRLNTQKERVITFTCRCVNTMLLNRKEGSLPGSERSLFLRRSEAARCHSLSSDEGERPSDRPRIRLVRNHQINTWQA